MSCPTDRRADAAERARELREVIGGYCYEDAPDYLYRELRAAEREAAGERFTLTLEKVNGNRVWPYFAPHHYLTAKFAGHHAFLAVLPDGEPVAFTSLISFPHGHIKRGWRGHRTVVLPDYQGLGIGARLSDWLGEHVVTVMGGRFFSKTSHPRLGAYRDASPYWRATSSNRKRPTEKGIAAQAAKLGWVADIHRDTFSHEYLGRPRG